MIVPMKKLSILVMDKDRNSSLKKIRDLGVLHIQKKTVNSPALSKLLTRNTQLEAATGILDAFAPRKNAKLKPPSFDWDISGRVVALYERRKKLQDAIFSYQREIGRFNKWGEFNPKDFAYLAENGVNAFLYELPLDTYREITGNVPVVIISTDKKNNVARLVAFAKIPDRAPYPLPDVPLSFIEEKNNLQKQEMTKIEEELTSFSTMKTQMEEDRKTLAADIEFETAKAGMEQLLNESGNKSMPNLSVSHITGYVPAPDMGAVKRAASENGWALCATDPADDDMEVPTKLKNGKFAQLIYPATDFLELIPGYHETDISGWFLIFFTLFFGMIFGDAAYGIILFLIAVLGILKTAKKGVPLGFKFLLLMSVSNIIWGVLICSWFGLEMELVPQFLQNLSLPSIAKVSAAPGWFDAYMAGNLWVQSGVISAYSSAGEMAEAIDKNLMLFCFSIALVQLGIAHIKNGIGCLRSLKIFAEIGRLGMIFGMYFVVLSLVVNNTGFEGVQMWQYYTLAGGFVLVFIFGSYEGNLVKSILESCKNFITVVLSITNVFSDIMSYIRLWAVGLAAASIAGMINSLAGPMFGRFAFFILGIVFFAFGHGFNMVLNVLAVLVHGVRLNMLEFSSHVGLSWSGLAYKPFTRNKV